MLRAHSDTFMGRSSDHTSHVEPGGMARGTSSAASAGFSRPRGCIRWRPEEERSPAARSKSGGGSHCNAWTVSMMVKFDDVAARPLLSTGGWDQWCARGDGANAASCTTEASASPSLMPARVRPVRVATQVQDGRR